MSPLRGELGLTPEQRRLWRAARLYAAAEKLHENADYAYRSVGQDRGLFEALEAADRLRAKRARRLLALIAQTKSADGVPAVSSHANTERQS